MPGKPSGTTKGNLQPHDIRSRAWEVVGTDLFNCNNHEYLIIADYYSKFPIIRKMNGLTTSNLVISTMKQVFSGHGIPSRVVSDNGPQYSSEAFKEFAPQWQFDHITSSPKFPKSNRFIERQIQTIKKALIKAKQAGRDPNLAMLCLRPTPINHNLTSPSELLNNRILRSNLIARVSAPRFSNTHHIREELKHRICRKCIMIEEHVIYHHLFLGKMYVYWMTKLGNGNQQQSQVDVRNPDHTSFNSQMDHQKDETESK